MVLQVPRLTTAPEVIWEKLPADYVLPDDPVENIQQPWLAAALTDALDTAGAIRPEMLVVSNFALVATVKQQTIVKAPDWLYVPQVFPAPPGVIRRSYTPYTEGEPVAVVMEFLSVSDCGELSQRSSYPYGKLYFYEQILKVPIYVTFDPGDASLEVRELDGQGRYHLQTADAQGRYWIPALNLHLGLWYGKRLEQQIYWLRWWDEAGNLLLWGSEKAEQAEQKAEQAEQKAEQAEQKAEQERLKAEAAEAELARLRSLLRNTPPSDS
jgi:Uma2 family endonuclease